jgi:hypothetical protein
MGAVVGGCSATLSSPTASPSGEQAPVNLRELQITSVEGHRAVLLRLSRLPTLVRYSSSSNPGRITIQAWGPVGDGDLPERVLPQDDPQVAQVRVSRQEGGLRVVLDLKSDEPPAHTVHEMADWIMVRLTESGS